MSTNTKAGSIKVFLCHSSADKQAVRLLYRRLQASGFLPWLDEEDLIPGHDWEMEIPKAVQASDVVLVCLSQAAITKRGYVQKEIRFALDVADEQPEGAIFIIPVKLEECDIPSRLRRWQWVNLFEDSGYDRLLRAFKTVAGSCAINSPVFSVGFAQQISSDRFREVASSTSFSLFVPSRRFLLIATSTLFLGVGLYFFRGIWYTAWEPIHSVKQSPLSIQTDGANSTNEPSQTSLPANVSKEYINKRQPPDPRKTLVQQTSQTILNAPLPEPGHPDASDNVQIASMPTAPVAMPVDSSRWRVEENVIVDLKSGLMWTRGDLKTITGKFAKNWDDAMRWPKEMNDRNYAGHSDWRPASIAEYRTIYGAPFRQVFRSDGEDYYWAKNEISKYVASYFDFHDGFATSGDKSEQANAQTGQPFLFSVRLVRKSESTR